MIQGGIIPQLFHEEAFPNLVNAVGIPRLGELSHSVASSAASTASNALNGFQTHFNKFRNDLGQYIQIPSNYGAWHRFAYGETWPNFADRAVRVLPSGQGQVVMPGLSGNYGSVNGGAASAAAASSAASGGLAKR